MIPSEPVVQTLIFASAVGNSLQQLSAFWTMGSVTNLVMNTSCGCILVVVESICGSQIKKQWNWQIKSARRLSGGWLWYTEGKSLRKPSQYVSAPDYYRLICSESVGVRDCNDLKFSFRNAYQTLSPVFVDLILNDQDLFATDEGFEFFCKLIPDEKVAEQLRKEKVAGSSSKDVWDCFTEKVRSCRDKQQKVSRPMIFCKMFLGCPSCS